MNQPHGHLFLESQEKDLLARCLQLHAFTFHSTCSRAIKEYRRFDKHVLLTLFIAEGISKQFNVYTHLPFKWMDGLIDRQIDHR